MFIWISSWNVSVYAQICIYAFTAAQAVGFIDGQANGEVQSVIV